MLKRLSYPLSWVEGLTGEGQTGGQNSQSDSLPTSADSQQSTSVFSKVFNSSPMNLVEFGTGLFLSKTPSEEAPQAHETLSGRSSLGGFGRSQTKAANIPAGRPLPRSTPLMSYGRKRMKPEYWFGVPRNRVDDLFKFLNHWVPDRYGPLGDERSGSSGDVSDLTRESWEVLSMSDELRRALYSSGASVDMEFSPPDLIGTSEIFTMEHREKLCGVLPARAQGYMWSLAFSTSQHGFSLASMYRKMQRVDSPVLLVFGALTSCALRPSEHFYGTGESFLFAFQRVEDARRPSTTDNEQAVVKTKFKSWGWTGDNIGKFGIWLDGDLYQGRTERCTTYGNDPLTTREDFVVKIMECWTFI
ncbi:unnamed protein product [Leptidea sinapis]|uniref:Oxidation resistance protein 1 n=1 Tax=Leptidea sinapis TaxID=189913 RepID=A0A5E4PSZ1_9NEOP|nr:unnamed protein product [Leptidea sinapis]